MQPQGTSLVNAAYIAQVTAEINSINTCALLQQEINAVAATLNAELASIQLNIDVLLPLITIPTDLGSVIAWISHLAQQYIGPYLNYIAQLEQLAVQIALLVAAIEAAVQRLSHCQIAVPQITVPVPPVNVTVSSS
jgi:hypothetical protein